MRMYRKNKGLVMITALMVLLTLSSVSMMQLHSLITQVGTSRWYRVDAIARNFTMGGADAVLGLALKNPGGFENYLKTHNYQIDHMNKIAQYFTTLKNDSKSVFAPDDFTADFSLTTSAPEIISNVPGYEMGKYCMRKYYMKVTTTLNQNNETYTKNMRGVMLIGPSLCE